MMDPSRNTPNFNLNKKNLFYAGVDIAARTYTVATCYRDQDPSKGWRVRCPGSEPEITPVIVTS